MGVSTVAVGTWVPKDQVQAFYQKIAEDNAKKQADAKAAAPQAAPAAPATDASSKSSAVPQDATKVSSSAVVATQSQPSSSATTSKAGSVETENAGMANSARINIETLNSGISLYNGAKKTLEDTNELSRIRREYGDQKADEFITMIKGVMETGLSLMAAGASMMQNDCTVTGTVATQDDSGNFKAGQYKQQANGTGWSVSVKSSGEATAIANGVDVSDQVSNSSSAGFDWRDVIAKRQAQPNEPVQPSGTNNIDAVLKLLEQARTTLDDFVARARKALADYTPPQTATPPAAKTIDVSA